MPCHEIAKRERQRIALLAFQRGKQALQIGAVIAARPGDACKARDCQLAIGCKGQQVFELVKLQQFRLQRRAHAPH